MYRLLTVLTYVLHSYLDLRSKSVPYPTPFSSPVVASMTNKLTTETWASRSTRQCLEHGRERGGAHAARVRAVHLHDAQAERMHGGAATRVARAPPPHLAAGGAPVEAEPMRAHLDGRLAPLAQAIAELPREAGEWKRQTQRRRRLGGRGACN